jgi:hypothetical protein
VVQREPRDMLDEITERVRVNAEKIGKMKGYIARAKPGVKTGKFDEKLEMYQKFLQEDRSEQASK